MDRDIVLCCRPYWGYTRPSDDVPLHPLPTGRVGTPLADDVGVALGMTVPHAFVRSLKRVQEEMHRRGRHARP